MKIESAASKMLTVELARAREKHPLFPTDIIHAINILSEEVGEAIKAAEQWTYGNGNSEAVFKEIAQAGAMALRILDNRDCLKPRRSPQRKDF